MFFVRTFCVALCVALSPSFAFARETGPPTLDFTPLGTPASNGGGSAPMDSSFGTYPMSVFGIASAIHRYDGTRRLDDGPIAYAIVAIRDWEHRYPNDPWIARELLAMQRVYEHAHTERGTAYERAVAVWLEHDYPASIFASSSRSDLAKSEAKPETKTESKPETKTESKPETKVESKPEVHEEPRPQHTPMPTSPSDGEPLPSYAQPLNSNAP